LGLIEGVGGRWSKLSGFVAFLVLLSGGCFGEELASKPSSRIPAEHMKEYSDLAVQWMQEYLRVDTTNPPGNEMRAVAFYKNILDREGIENRVFEFVPGRGDLWARVPASAEKRQNPHFSRKRPVRNGAPAPDYFVESHGCGDQ
jgi:hypothetical protein